MADYTLSPSVAVTQGDQRWLSPLEAPVEHSAFWKGGQSPMSWSALLLSRCSREKIPDATGAAASKRANLHKAQAPIGYFILSISKHTSVRNEACQNGLSSELVACATATKQQPRRVLRRNAVRAKACR